MPLPIGTIITALVKIINKLMDYFADRKRANLKNKVNVLQRKVNQNEQMEAARKAGDWREYLRVRRGIVRDKTSEETKSV